MLLFPKYTMYLQIYEIKSRHSNFIQKKMRIKIKFAKYKDKIQTSIPLSSTNAVSSHPFQLVLIFKREQ